MTQGVSRRGSEELVNKGESLSILSPSGEGPGLEEEDLGEIGIFGKAFKESVREGLGAIPLTKVHMALDGGLGGACAEGGADGVPRLEKGSPEDGGFLVLVAPEERPEAELVKLLKFVDGIVALCEGVAEFAELALPVGIPDGASHRLAWRGSSGAGWAEGMSEAGEAVGDGGPAVKPGGDDGGPFGIVFIEELAGKGGSEQGAPESEEGGGVPGRLGLEVFEGGSGIAVGQLDEGQGGGGEEETGWWEVVGLTDALELLPCGGKVLFGKSLIGDDPADEGTLGQIRMRFEEGGAVTGGFFPVTEGLVDTGKLKTEKGPEAFGFGIFAQPAFEKEGGLIEGTGLHGGKPPEPDADLVEFRLGDFSFVPVPVVKGLEGGQGCCGIPAGERPAGGLPLFSERHDGNERERKEGEQKAGTGTEGNPHGKHEDLVAGRGDKGSG